MLADPEGYAFDVIEPGNSFLAGCGFLGEIACDGTREVASWSGRTRPLPGRGTESGPGPAPPVDLGAGVISKCTDRCESAELCTLRSCFAIMPMCDEESRAYARIAAVIRAVAFSALVTGSAIVAPGDPEMVNSLVPAMSGRGWTAGLTSVV